MTLTSPPIKPKQVPSHGKVSTVQAPQAPEIPKAEQTLAKQVPASKNPASKAGREIFTSLQLNVPRTPKDAAQLQALESRRAKQDKESSSSSGQPAQNHMEEISAVFPTVQS